MVCPNCKNELLQDEILDDSMNKIYDTYLSLFDLSFDMLKEIRTNLNLSQELMAKILGWSKKSIVRYENAESIPQGEYLNMYMKLNDDPFYIMKILESQREIIDEDEYYKIIEKLPFYSKYKRINSILYLLKDNSLYETSLMKNLFAVDFINYKENGYIELDLINDNITKFKCVFDYDKNLFSESELRTLGIIKNKLKRYSAKSLSDWSHKFKGWIDTKDGEVIDYSYAIYLNINDL